MDGNKFDRLRAGFVSDAAKACIDFAEDLANEGEGGVRRTGDVRQWVLAAVKIDGAKVPAELAALRDELEELKRRSNKKAKLKAVDGGAS